MSYPIVSCFCHELLFRNTLKQIMVHELMIYINLNILCCYFRLKSFRSIKLRPDIYTHFRFDTTRLATITLYGVFIMHAYISRWFPFTSFIVKTIKITVKVVQEHTFRIHLSQYFRLRQHLDISYRASSFLTVNNI